MSLDYYATDDEREKFIKKVEEDEYLLYGIREKCRDYVDFILQFANSTRKDLYNIETADDAVRIHGDVSGITKLMKAFGIGLDQSVTNEPTEIDLKDWANLSLFRVAIIRRKFSAAKIFVEKTGSAEYLIKIETMLFAIHKFLTTGDWDEDEVEALESDTFLDTSFLSDQGIIDEIQTTAAPPPPKAKEESKKKKKKEKKKEEEEKGSQQANNGEIEKNHVVKENGIMDENGNKQENQVNSKDDHHHDDDTEKVEIIKEETKVADQKDEKNEESEEEEEEEKNDLKLDMKAMKSKTPNTDRRSNFMSIKRKSFSNLFKGKVNTLPHEPETLSQRESYLRDSVSILEYKAKKFTWRKHWIVLNLENIEIYKDEKSVTLSKAIPLSSITKLEEPADDFEFLTTSTFGLSKKNVHVPSEVFHSSDDKRVFVVEFHSKNSTQNFCFQTKNQRDMAKWLVTLDSLVGINKVPLIEPALKVKYLSANESHTNTGTINNDNHSWKYDGKRFKLKNKASNLAFTWNGSRLKQRGGENIGVLDWDGVSLKWEKYDNVKFTWIEADKEFQVHADGRYHSWNYNGESLYRKDDKSISFIVKNRPPIGIILAVCIISSFLSNLPLWEVQTPKTPAERNEEIIKSKRETRAKKGILSAASRSRLVNRFKAEKEKQQAENNGDSENNNNAPKSPREDVFKSPRLERLERESTRSPRSPRTGDTRSPRRDRKKDDKEDKRKDSAGEESPLSPRSPKDRKKEDKKEDKEENEDKKEEKEKKKKSSA